MIRDNLKRCCLAASTLCFLSVLPAQGQTAEDVDGDGCTFSPEDCVISSPTSSVSTTSGAVGSTVVVTADNVSAVTYVSFGSISTSFTINSPTQITTTVPAGANSSHLILDFPGGAYVSDLFTVVSLLAPTIANLLPDDTDFFPGHEVTATGTGFTDVTSVAFSRTTGGSPWIANFTADNSGQLRAVVPNVDLEGSYRLNVCTAASGCASSNDTINVISYTCTLCTPEGTPPRADAVTGAQPPR